MALHETLAQRGNLDHYLAEESAYTHLNHCAIYMHMMFSSFTNMLQLSYLKA